ncbi:MAG: hypothetical protein ACFFBH_10315 [Promethearchaeota archaeon]
MVLVVNTVYFPANKSAEVGKKYLEILKMVPPDKTLAKIIIPLAIRITHEGMKAFSVVEVKKGKFKEWMQQHYKEVLSFAELEGFKQEIEVFMSGGDALPLVGLNMPNL